MNSVVGIYCFHSIHILYPPKYIKSHKRTQWIVWNEQNALILYSRRSCRLVFCSSFSLSLIQLQHNGLSIWLKNLDYILSTLRFNNWTKQYFENKTRNTYEERAMCFCEKKGYWNKHDSTAWNGKSCWMTIQRNDCILAVRFWHD